MKRHDHAAPVLRLNLMQFIGLRDAHREVPGFYWSVGALDREASWGGASLQLSRDFGRNWDTIATTSSECWFGDCHSALSANESKDFTSEAIIEMHNGKLESVGEAGAKGGRWLGWLSGEVFAAENSRRREDGRYLVSNLYRGRQGTRWAVPYHNAGGQFVLLSGPGVNFHRVELEDLGKNLHVRAVGSYGAPELATSHGLVVSGANVKRGHASADVLARVREVKLELAGACPG